MARNEGRNGHPGGYKVDHSGRRSIPEIDLFFAIDPEERE
jgi:hypothetical protein